MAKNDMTIVDMAIDGANGAALERVNEHFKLNLPRRRFWVFKERAATYRERVRAAVLEQFKKGV